MIAHLVFNIIYILMQRCGLNYQEEKLFIPMVPAAYFINFVPLTNSPQFYSFDS